MLTIKIKNFLKEMLPSLAGALVGLLVLQYLFGPPISTWFEGKPQYVQEGNYQEHFIDLKPDMKVIMYGTKWCPYCKKAREYFDSNNISYMDYDVESSDKQMKVFKSLGGNAYPLILLRNRKIIGFQKKALGQLLDIRPDS